MPAPIDNSGSVSTQPNYGVCQKDEGPKYPGGTIASRTCKAQLAQLFYGSSSMTYDQQQQLRRDANHMAQTGRPGASEVRNTLSTKAQNAAARHEKAKANVEPMSAADVLFAAFQVHAEGLLTCPADVPCANAPAATEQSPAAAAGASEASPAKTPANLYPDTAEMKARFGAVMERAEKFKQDHAKRLSQGTSAGDIPPHHLLERPIDRSANPAVEEFESYRTSMLALNQEHAILLREDISARQKNPRHVSNPRLAAVESAIRESVHKYQELRTKRAAGADVPGSHSGQTVTEEMQTAVERMQADVKRITEEVRATARDTVKRMGKENEERLKRLI